MTKWNNMNLSVDKAIINFQDTCKEFATNYMKDNGELPMVVAFLAQNEDNKFVTLLAPNLGRLHSREDKPVFVEAVKQAIKVVKPIAVAMLTEAWVVKHNKDEGPVDLSIPPSEQPTREEVVLIQIETYKNAYITMYDIIRTTSDSIELKLDDKISEGALDKENTDGLFSNLLKENYDNFYKSIEENLNKFQN